jgi:hypothetical protein
MRAQLLDSHPNEVIRVARYDTKEMETGADPYGGWKFLRDLTPRQLA